MMDCREPLGESCIAKLRYFWKLQHRQGMSGARIFSHSSFSQLSFLLCNCKWSEWFNFIHLSLLSFDTFFQIIFGLISLWPFHYISDGISWYYRKSVYFPSAPPLHDGIKNLAWIRLQFWTAINITLICACFRLDNAPSLKKKKKSVKK